jgi:muramoyltetrapeptide carboxypeptidase
MVFPEELFTDQTPFHSSSDENRLAKLKKALQNDEPDTILWSLRGGYGVARLLPELQKIPKPTQEKILIGYSDLTALHLFLAQNWGWKTIHGPMIADLLNPQKSPENFLKITDIIAKKRDQNIPIVAEIPHLVPLNEQAKITTSIEGLLTGGNLTIVQTSIGTDWEIKAKNKILFLEDDGERGYRIDRALNHLKQAGLLKCLKAIVFGDFTDSDEFMEFALQRFANENDVPMYKSNEFGHGKKNSPLIYNAPSVISRNPQVEKDWHMGESEGQKGSAGGRAENYRLTMKFQ